MRLSGTKANSTNQYRGLGDQLYDLGGARPTLDLNFANNDSLADSISGKTLPTFTRASSGTYVDGDGLIKTTPVNLLTYSEQSDFWLKTNATVTANVIAAPDGSITADQLNRTSTGNSNYIRRGTSKAASSITYTASIYFKKDDARYASIRLQGSYPSRADVTFDLDTGTVSRGPSAFSSFSGASAAIVPVTDGWYRCSLTATTDSHTSANAYISCSAENNFADGQSTAINSVYVWGAQLEEGSTATDYIPTTSTISGAPRFDHDPATGESLGLLIEEARTNDITNNYSTASTKTGVFLSQITSIINPDGTTGTIKATTTATSNQHSITINTANESTNHSVSVFVKKGNHRYVGLTFGGQTNNIHCIFDFDTKTIIDDGGIGTRTFVSAGFEEYANGWFRLHVVGFHAGSSMRVFLAEDDQQNGLENWTSSGGEFMYVWGPQKEEGSFPTSYIPTSGSTVTRAADVAEITGADFAKTNLLQYSERFDETWSTNGTIVPNATTAPDGTLTADKFFTDSSDTGARLSQTPTVANGTYTLSFYAKAGDTTSGKCVIKERNPNGIEQATCTYNLNNGTITVNDDGSGALTNQGIESAGNGWYRIFLTFNKASGTDLECRIMDFASISNKDGLFFWGAQLEEGSVLTDYTPSVETFVSRASSATYVDDTTGLIKTTPVNLKTYSNDFSQVWSQLSASILSSNNADAFGGNTATRLDLTGTTGRLQINNTNVTGIHTFSVYMRHVSGSDQIKLLLQTSPGVNSGDTVTVTSEWQRFSTTQNVVSGGGIQIRNSGSPSVIEVFAVQLEEGSTATDYIPTTNTISGAARYENGELLLEEARTNLVPYSSDLSAGGTAWIKNNATVSLSSESAPDGSLAYKYTATSSSNNIIEASLSPTQGSVATLSFWVKNISATEIRLGVLDQGSSSWIITPNESASYISEINTTTWTRIKRTFTVGNGTVAIYPAHTVNNGGEVLIWGVQLEEGSYASSYIPTSGSAVTRAADVSTSALGVDSFYNQSEGTVFSEYSVLGDKTNISQTIYRFSDGTGDNAITEFKRSNGNETVSQLKVNGSATGRIEGNTNTPFNERYKTAFAFDGTDSQRAIKGNASSTAAVSSMPTINQLKLGSGYNNTYPGTFYISRLAYFNTRLPDASLENITS